MDEPARSRGMRREKSIAVFAAAIILVAAFWVLAYRSSDNGVTKATETSTDTSSQATVTNTTETSSQGMALLASDYNSSLGLALTLSISNGTIPQDDGISLHIALNNTLATQNNLPPANGSAFWQPSWNLQPCSTFPIGVEIFQGNYALGNLSKGEPLSFVVPAGYNCADHPPSAISFAPLSGNITSPADWFLNQSAWSTEYWGYWTGSVVPPSSDAAFHSFEPGIYTLIGEDWWGQVAALHFQVIENENPLDCATITSNPSFVAYTNGSASTGPLKLQAFYQDTRVNNTVVLALSDTGNSTLALLSFDTESLHFGYTPYQFSPDGSQIQRWQYYAPNGTLGYPGFFYPNKCSLISMTFSSPFPQVPLTLSFTNGETQMFTFKP
jgi:hypothetical protein